jgi:hypothetical protein
MNEVKIDKIDDFKKFVETMEVNTQYLLPDNFRYKWIKIEKEKEYYSKDIYFTWAMEYNYKVAGSVGYIYPISGSNKVTHFKTEKGAKTNFLKRYADYFEPLCV